MYGKIKGFVEQNYIKSHLQKDNKQQKCCLFYVYKLHKTNNMEGVAPVR